MSAEAPPAAAPSVRHPGRGRSRRRSPWRWPVILTASLLGLLTACGLGGALWVKHYLQSEAFRERLNAESRRVLSADAELSDLAWQDTTAYAGAFQAKGTRDALFRDLAVSDIRARINTGALWDRVWRVEGVEAERVEVDFSQDGRLPSLPPEPPAETGESRGWLQRLLPNRAEIGPVRVKRFDFLWRDGLNRAEGREFALNIKPSVRESFATVSGTGGRVRLSGFGKECRVLRLEATVRGQGVRVDELTAEIDGARLTADGVVETKPQPALLMNVNLSEMKLASWIPESWLRKCSGKVQANARITGDPRTPSRLQAKGGAALRDGGLQGLPVLEVIARKTRNEAFLRLLLQEARCDFTRLPDGALVLEKIRIDAPGLLRLKGAVMTGADESLRGDLLVGIVPGTLRYLAGAEQTVFLPPDRAGFTSAERAVLTEEDNGLLWTRLTLRGTLSSPSGDLADRLARAWFNATVDEVLKMSMEGAAGAAEAASKLAGAAAEKALDSAQQAVPAVLEAAPRVLENGLKQGLNLLDSLTPR